MFGSRSPSIHRNAAPLARERVRRSTLSILTYVFEMAFPFKQRLNFCDRWTPIQNFIEEQHRDVDFLVAVGACNDALSSLRNLEKWSIVRDHGVGGTLSSGVPPFGAAMSVSTRSGWSLVLRNRQSKWTAAVDMLTTPLSVLIRLSERGMTYRLAVADWSDFSNVIIPSLACNKGIPTVNPNSTLLTSTGTYVTAVDARREYFRLLGEAGVDLLTGMTRMPSDELGSCGFRDASTPPKTPQEASAFYTSYSSMYAGLFAEEGKVREQLGEKHSRMVRCMYRRGYRQFDGGYSIVPISCVAHQVLLPDSTPERSPTEATVHRPLVSRFDMVP